MLKSRANLFKGILSSILFVVMIFSMCPVSVFAAGNDNSTVDVTEKYIVPITSLESAAPLKSVKTAFSKAFGDSVVVTVNSDGTKTALIKSQHMVIDFMSKSYDANVASVVDADTSTERIEKATVISKKQDVYHAGLKASKTTAITVPDEFTIPLNLDDNNSQELSITVDFMDAFMGSGKSFPTNVTLTLDMDSAVIEVSDADYTLVDKAIASIPKDLTAYTAETSKAVTDAVSTVERGLSAEKQPQVDAMAQAITQAVSSLKKAQSDDPDKNNSKIGTIGIVIAVVLVTVIGICVWYFCFYKKTKKE